MRKLLEFEIGHVAGGHCGPGRIGDYLVPDLWFGEACKGHDPKYLPSSKYSKSQADDIFLNEMK